MRIRKLSASWLLVALLETSGCASNDGYHTSGNSGSYYYSDPHICTSERAVCPLLIAGLIGGIVAVAASH